MKACPSCGKENDDAEKFCAECGTVLDEDFRPPAGSESEPVDDPEPGKTEVQPAPTPPSNFSLEKPKLSLTLFLNGVESPTLFPVNDTVVVGKFTPESGPVDINLADLGIPDTQYISRKHATIILRSYAGGFAWAVKDLGSMNGTWLNGSKLEPHTEAGIQDGDIIHFANMKFSVRMGG